MEAWHWIDIVGLGEEAADKPREVLEDDEAAEVETGEERMEGEIEL